MADEQYTLRVFRGDAAGGTEEEYRVPAVPGMVVLDAILYIQAHTATDLAVRWNCKAAHCGSCSAEVNGFPKLMCKTRLDLYAGQTIHVGPMRTFPVIKDLVTDVSWNYRVNEQIAPFTHEPGDTEPWTMYQEDVERLYEPRKCIECFLCQDVCHVLRNHDEKNRYFGPRFMVRYQYLDMHPKDVLDRHSAIKDKAGVGLCNITKCCQEVCPEHIKITDNSIIPLKERVADEYFDPVRWLGRKITGRYTASPVESDAGPGEQIPGPVGTPQRPAGPGALQPRSVGFPYLAELESILELKDLRTADRAVIARSVRKIRNRESLSTQERETLWSYLDRYGRLEKGSGRAASGE